jgi:transcriptional regulator PpsR
VSRRSDKPADLSALSVRAHELAQVFVSLSSDVALVIDASGTVISVAQNPGTPVAEVSGGWLGKRWVETVTDETRLKIERLLLDVSTTGMGRRREVNHAGGVHGDVPVSYTALRLGENGPVLAVGRDLRTVSAIQQRFLSTQQEVERSYWRTRQAESRHRLLLHVATDAVVSIDTDSRCIVEGNPAASVLLGGGSSALAGRVLEHQFDANSRPVVRELINRARSSGRSAESSVRLAGTHISVRLQALPLPAANNRLLLRARTSESLLHDAFPLETALVRMVEGTRDGVVLTDVQGRVLSANRAFVRMVQAHDEDELLGRPLGDWLGRVAGDAPGLTKAAHERGICQDVRLGLRRSGRGPLEVELTATLLVEGDQEGLGFVIRPWQAEDTSAPAAELAEAAEVARAIQTLSSGLGTTALADLVRSADRLMRKHFVQRALKIGETDAAAAMLLDVSTAQLARLKHELALEALTPKR